MVHQCSGLTGMRLYAESMSALNNDGATPTSITNTLTMAKKASMPSVCSLSLGRQQGLTPLLDSSSTGRTLRVPSGFKPWSTPKRVAKTMLSKSTSAGLTGGVIRPNWASALVDSRRAAENSSSFNEAKRDLLLAPHCWRNLWTEACGGNSFGVPLPEHTSFSMVGPPSLKRKTQSVS